MFTHAQQLLASSLTLLFGVLSYGVARRLRAGRIDRPQAGWVLAAWCYLVVGGVSVAHALSAAVASAAGTGSAWYAAHVAWTGPANIARSLVVLVFAAMLVGVLVLKRAWAPRLAARAPLAMAATMLVTLVAARVDGGLVGYRHIAALGVLSAATALVLMAALLAAVANDGLDQLLWFAVSAYALKEVVSTSLYAILVWGAVGDPAGLLEAFRVFYWLSAAVMAGMSLLALRRRARAAAGRHVPALFERMHALRPRAADWSAHQ